VTAKAIIVHDKQVKFNFFLKREEKKNARLHLHLPVAFHALEVQTHAGNWPLPYCDLMIHSMGIRFWGQKR
jgi:hypothetical protein